MLPCKLLVASTCVLLTKPHSTPTRGSFTPNAPNTPPMHPPTYPLVQLWMGVKRILEARTKAPALPAAVAASASKPTSIPTKVTIALKAQLKLLAAPEAALLGEAIGSGAQGQQPGQLVSGQRPGQHQLLPAIHVADPLMDVRVAAFLLKPDSRAVTEDPAKMALEAQLQKLVAEYCPQDELAGQAAGGWGL